MPLLYRDWRSKLLAAAGTASADVVDLGEFILEFLHRDGCEPTMAALLEYVQFGLHPAYEARKPAKQARALAAPPA